MADQEKQLDRLLDSMLANYADEEPRPGFETRLLANLREPRPACRFWWLWAGATAALMAVATFAIYQSRLGELPPAPKIQIAGPPALPPIRTVTGQGATPHPRTVRPEAQQAASAVDVRQGVFPTPVPLSEQEALMLRYLAGTPRSEVASHAREDEPAEQGAPFVPESQHIRSTEIFSTQ